VKPDNGLDFELPSQYGVGFGVGSAEYGKEEQGKARRNRLGQAAGLQRFRVETLKSERVTRGVWVGIPASQPIP
jgi:hypothetical protein